MKTYLDCIPCLFWQALKTSRIATNNVTLQEDILRQTANLIGQLDLSKSPPYTARKIYKLINQITGCADPYYDIKNKSNKWAMSLYSQMKLEIERSPHPIKTAIKLAIAGNIIDFGANNNTDEETIQKSIDASLNYHFDASVLDRLQTTISKSKNILYLGDNAGEIVFDRLLIEQILPKKIIYVVRSVPIINDITMTDAIETGINKLVEKVIESGSDAPGTILKDCSNEFINYFEKADLIIAKGQGNYETLNQEKKRIFFLLKVKCQVVARNTNSKIGSSAIIEIS